MKDDPLMKTTVSSIDGSRFATTSLSTEAVVGGMIGAGTNTASRPSSSRLALSTPDESLVVDDRSHLTPAQMVETKLISRLRGSSLPVSHLQMRGLVRARYEA